MVKQNGPSHVLFEYVSMGAYIKVCAVDEKTGTEVTIVGDARATQDELQRTALRKLQFVMSKSEKARR